jgi:hypothetical protein
MKSGATAGTVLMVDSQRAGTRKDQEIADNVELMITRRLQ